MRAGTIVGLLLIASLAGCTGGSGPDHLDEAPGPAPVQAGAGPGSLRGVVVDTAITPLPDATVRLMPLDLEAVTDADGAFRFTGLEPGAYFLQAQLPLYATVQQSVEVRAGNEAVARLVLERTVPQDPYVMREKHNGYIACSVNLVVVLSEECGEGVGIPGLGRVGGMPNNRAQVDFNVDGAFIHTLVVEQAWEPSLSVGGPGGQSGGFYTVLATEWSCEPVCSGSRLGTADGASPLLIRADRDALEALDPTSETVFSTFTWASTQETGVLLEQEFELFISAFYHLEAPEDWSFLAGDPDPF